MGSGVEVGKGVAVEVAVGLGVKTGIWVGSGLGLVGVCRMQAEASKVTAMSRITKTAVRE